jgi:hypothetical protein
MTQPNNNIYVTIQQDDDTKCLRQTVLPDVSLDGLVGKVSTRQLGIQDRTGGTGHMDKTVRT